MCSINAGQSVLVNVYLMNMAHRRRHQPNFRLKCDIYCTNLLFGRTTTGKATSSFYLVLLLTFWPFFQNQSSELPKTSEFSEFRIRIHPWLAPPATCYF